MGPAASLPPQGTVFHLALRQTEGFVASLIHLMGLPLKTPDHSTLSRRSRYVEVPAQGRTGIMLDFTRSRNLADNANSIHV